MPTASLGDPALRTGVRVETEHAAVDLRDRDDITDDRGAAAQLDRRRVAPQDHAGREVDRDERAGVAAAEIRRRDVHHAVRDHRRRLQRVTADRLYPVRDDGRRELARTRTAMIRAAAELRPRRTHRRRGLRAHLEARDARDAACLDRKRVRAKRQRRQRRAQVPAARRPHRDRIAAIDARLGGHLGIEFRRDDREAALRRHALPCAGAISSTSGSSTTVRCVVASVSPIVTTR